MLDKAGFTAKKDIAQDKKGDTMKEKTISALVLTIVIIVALGGLYFIYDYSVGKTYAGLQKYVEAKYARETAEETKGLEKEDAINQMYDLLEQEKRACVTFVHITSRAIQQRIVTNAEEARSLERLTEPKTWKIIDVSKAPCKPIEIITGTEKPSTRWMPSDLS